MFTKTIAISNFECAKRFVNITNKYMNLNINLLCDDYVIDAHSIMGIFSLDMNKPIRLEAHGERLNDFIKDLELFAT